MKSETALQACAVGQECVCVGGGGFFRPNVDQTIHDFQLDDVIDNQLGLSG